jgi:hypothetical protein
MADDEYERERQENIRKNRELMLSLGLNVSQLISVTKEMMTLTLCFILFKPAEPSRNKLQVKKTSKPIRKIKDEGSDEEEQKSDRITRSKGTRNSLTKTAAYPEPSRKSARLSAQSTISYNEDDEALGRRSRRRKLEDEDEDNKQNLYMMPKLKKLRNPSPPPESENYESEIYANAPSPPKRESNGNIIFENNNRHFMPNVTPKE